MISIRKIGVFGRTYRNLNRYRQILTVFIKYGFGDLFDRLNIDQYIEVGLKMLRRKGGDVFERHTTAERVRLAVEELGPTFIKMGQVLSTRPDLISMEFIRELAKLQDKAPSVDYEKVKAVFLSEFQKEPGDIFRSFDKKPLASASIGQVHKAVLINGDVVAVKVQKPGIKRIIEVDLEIMLHIATLIERNIEELSFHKPVKIVEEFAKTLEKEIDYTIESAAMMRIDRDFINDPDIYIPLVYSEFSSHRILTTEFINGIKVSDIERLDKENYDRKLITSNGARLYLTQIFNFGFFHADPHPGNIFVLPNNAICLIDFGMTGRLDRVTKELFVDLVDSVVNHNELKATRLLLKITTWDGEPDMAALEKDTADFINIHLYKPLKDIEIGKLFQNILELVTVHRLRIRPDIFLMMKALSTVESVAVTLYPDFDMIEAAKPFIKRIKLARFSPKRITEELAESAGELFEFAHRFPKDLLEVMGLIRKKNVIIKLEHQKIDILISALYQIINRLSFSILIGSLIIGSALIVVAKIPPLFHGISLVGIFGFTAAAVLAIWLLLAIIKRGRL